MKILRYIYCILIFFVFSCEENSTSLDNKKPSIFIVYPENNSVAPDNSTITLRVNASDNKSIKEVLFYIDDELKFSSIVKNTNPSCITIGYSWFAKKFGREILTEYKNLDIIIIEDPFSVVENLIECLEKKGNLNEVNGIAFRNNDKTIKINPNKISLIIFFLQI